MSFGKVSFVKPIFKMLLFILPGGLVTNFPEKSRRSREKIFRPDIVEEPLEVFAAKVHPQTLPGRDVLILGHFAGLRINLCKKNGIG